MKELKFSNEDLEEMQKTLDIILDDLEQLWEISTKTEIKVFFKSNIPSWSSLTDMEFCMNDVGIGIKGDYDPWMVIEKFSPFRNRKKLKHLNKSKVFYFLQSYEDIREKVVSNINSNSTIKENGIKKIIELGKKYDKEAIIEIEVPDSKNPFPLIVTKENGETIGTLKMGFGNIKIITKGNISLVKPDEIVEQKVKQIK